MPDWVDVTFGDVQMIEELSSQPSLRAWAQLKRLTPMKAGRLLQQLEQKLGCLLVLRNTQGIRLTQEGEKLSQMAKRLGPFISSLDQAISQDRPEPFADSLVIGTRGFLNANLAGPIARYFHGKNTNLDFVDISPSEMLEAAKKDGLDIALSLESTNLGKGWEEKNLGQLKWAVYGNPRHPLAGSALVKDIERYRLGHQCFWNGKIIESSMRRPHPTLKGVSQFGFGAQTALTAVQIASYTEQLICIPKIVGKTAVNSGSLVEIPVSSDSLPTSEVFLSVHTQRVKKSTFVELSNLLKAEIQKT